MDESAFPEERGRVDVDVDIDAGFYGRGGTLSIIRADAGGPIVSR